MVSLCFFDEFGTNIKDGSIKTFLTDKVMYDKFSVAKYLRNGKKIASCPKSLIEPIKGSVIANSFAILSDDKYFWVENLADLVEKYNITLPKEFLKAVQNDNN